MALTELRNKQNPWFEKRNHVRPAKNQVSKMFIDPSLGGGGPTLPEAPATLPNSGLALTHQWDAYRGVTLDDETGNLLTWDDQGSGGAMGKLTMFERHGDADGIPYELAPNGKPGLLFDKRRGPPYPTIWTGGAIETNTGKRNIYMCVSMLPNTAPWPTNEGPYFTGDVSARARGIWWDSATPRFREAGNLSVNGVFGAGYQPAQPADMFQRVQTLCIGSHTYVTSTFGNHGRTSTDVTPDTVMMGYIHEILIYENASVQAPAADQLAIHKYFMSKWFDEDATEAQYGPAFAEFDMTIGYNGVSDQYGYDDRVPMGTVDPVELRPGNNIRYFVVAADERIYFKTVSLIDTDTEIVLGITFDEPAGDMKHIQVRASWDGSLYFAGVAQAIGGTFEEFAANLGGTCKVKMYTNT